MAEANQYSFDLREATEALIKQQGLHEGLWMIAFEFNFVAGIVGGTPMEAKPSALVQIAKLQLVRPPDDSSKELPFLVDAAKVNPAA